MALLVTAHRRGSFDGDQRPPSGGVAVVSVEADKALVARAVDEVINSCASTWSTRCTPRRSRRR
jgi:hypothetical protein